MQRTIVVKLNFLLYRAKGAYVGCKGVDRQNPLIDPHYFGLYREKGKGAKIGKKR